MKGYVGKRRQKQRRRPNIAGIGNYPGQILPSLYNKAGLRIWKEGERISECLIKRYMGFKCYLVLHEDLKTLC